CSPRPSRDTRRRSPWSRSPAPTMRPWIMPWPPRPSSRSRVTPCCSHRPARPWTCSPTTPRVAMPSRRRSGGAMADQTDRETSSATEVVAAVSRLLRRPLASYHLVLGSTGLLLLLGLVMVFSASTFTSQLAYGDPYRIFVRQV